LLHEFIAVNREEIIRRCNGKGVASPARVSAAAAIDRGVAEFLDQLVQALRHRLPSNAEINKSAIQHGHELLVQGRTVSEVVHHYGDVCEAITGLAVEKNASISTEDFRVLNQCVDDAIAGAVTEYGRARNQVTLEGETARGSERLGFFAHELRNLITTAIMAFEVLKTGNVGVAGSTGTVLHRSLVGLGALIGRSLAESRLTQGVQNREPFLLAAFIDELAPAAALEASARGLGLTVEPIEEGVAIEADRQVLTAVVGNLLQNAFKFTRPHSHVTLRVKACAERASIEVQDECGGLPCADVNELFRPFEQRSEDRTGLGLGLAFCRWGTEANHGRISARSLPGEGCVFTVDLPRLVVPSSAMV
jgi:signal transduction histidine kinase